MRLIILDSERLDRFNTRSEKTSVSEALSAKRGQESER